MRVKVFTMSDGHRAKLIALRHDYMLARQEMKNTAQEIEQELRLAATEVGEFNMDDVKRIEDDDTGLYLVITTYQPGEKRKQRP